MRSRLPCLHCVPRRILRAARIVRSLYLGLINQLGVDRGLQTGFGTSLVLGAMGAAAVCTIAALLVRFDWAKVLRYCGRNSIVIYLVFPIPLAIMVKLIAIGNMSDSLAGPASVLTLAACIAGPLALHRILRSTPLSALFERPKWARLRIDVLASARGVVRT